MRVIAFDVGEEGAVVLRTQAVEMRPQTGHERVAAARKGLRICRVGEKLDAAVHTERPLRGQLAGRLEGGRELARLQLARLDIRLIEMVDANERAGNGGGEFPAEEFLTELVAVGDVKAQDGLTGPFEPGDVVVLGCVRVGREPDIDKKPIGAIDLASAER